MCSISRVKIKKIKKNIKLYIINKVHNYLRPQLF